MRRGLDEVNYMTKYPKLSGLVLKGQGKGKQTGLKTANLNIEIAKQIKLKPGLYNCEVIIVEDSFKPSRFGLLYYGYNSLSQTDCLEVHIKNFDQDIYGLTLKIIIKKYLRPPKKFRTIKELSEQVKKDLEK